MKTTFNLLDLSYHHDKNLVLKGKKNDNQMLLNGKDESIRSLVLILFVKSELLCKAPHAPGIILNFIS